MQVRILSPRLLKPSHNRDLPRLAFLLKIWRQQEPLKCRQSKYLYYYLDLIFVRCIFKKNYSWKLKFTFSFDLNISKIPGFIFIFLALQTFFYQFYVQIIGRIFLDKYLWLPVWLQTTLGILDLILILIAFIISIISYKKESEKVIKFLYISLSSYLFITIASSLFSIIVTFLKTISL